MEIYSKTTRFALACNASDKIIGEVAPRGRLRHAGWAQASVVGERCSRAAPHPGLGFEQWKGGLPASQGLATRTAYNQPPSVFAKLRNESAMFVT